MSIQVQVDGPMPDAAFTRQRLNYPYDEMDVGHSFFVAGGKIQQVCNSNARAAKRFGAKFTARREDDGVRVWRIE